MKYYKRHLGDYATDTGELSLVEHGAYTLLLDYYYSHQLPIPANRAYRICKASTDAEREAVDFVLNEYFELRQTHWHHAKCDEVICQAVAKSMVAQAKGKKGGLKAAARKKGGARLATAKENVATATPQLGKTDSESSIPLFVDQEQKKGADAPKADPIFGKGLSMLVRKGIPEPQARTFLGKLKATVRNDPIVVSWLTKAEDEDVSHPVQWLSRCLDKHARAGPKPDKAAADCGVLEDLRSELGLAARGNPDGLAEADSAAPAQLTDERWA